MNKKNILKEIVAKRQKDIEKTGCDFGFKIPAKRQRPIHPFLETKGTILEIKRASPSKGDIAPNLDSYKTAYEYASAGAKAISCLTEKNYFKGNLQDLMNACSAADSFEKETGRQCPSILRKDFLLNADEVEISYRAGADAVLLIAQILSKDKILEMAKKAEKLGISVLIEIRRNDDLEKLKYIMTFVNHNNIVCGVNSRNLQNFTIDMLIPARMIKKIKAISSDARVIFESGILSPVSAEFAASMGFYAILLGEAAARNPSKAKEFISSFENTQLTSNGKFWVEYANSYLERKKTLIKICGNTQICDAVFAAKHGADILGFVIWPYSKRNVNSQTIREIRKQIQIEMHGEKIPLFAGIIVEPESKEALKAYKLIEEGILDCIQIHTMKASRTFLENKELRKIPHYCAVNLASKKDIKNIDELNSLGEPRILLDAETKDSIGGTGKNISNELLSEVAEKYKLWIAGGIKSENVESIIAEYNPEIIDLVSSLESEQGKKDFSKMQVFFEKVQNTVI